MTSILEAAGTSQTTAAGSSKATRQYATFRVAEMFLGIDLARVQELMRYQEMASVPLAPPAVEGLINLRGQIVTALDMRRIFGLSGPSGLGDLSGLSGRSDRTGLTSVKSAEQPPMNIVIHSDGGPVSLLVDEICDVLDVPLAWSTRLPENLPPERRALLEGVYQLETSLLLVLSTERVVAAGAESESHRSV